VTALLAREFTCVRVDLRGHGDSSTASEYSTLSLVSDVRSVVEQIDIGEPAVVGHSLGATVAAVYAAVHPARAVICVDASLRFGDFAQLVQRHANALRSDRTMEAVLAIDHELGLEPHAGSKDMERRVLTFHREVLLRIWQALLTTTPEQLTAIAETILPRISAPLLALHGSLPPPDYRAWLARLVANAHLEVWDRPHAPPRRTPTLCRTRSTPTRRPTRPSPLLRKGKPSHPWTGVSDTAGKDGDRQLRLIDARRRCRRLAPEPALPMSTRSSRHAAMTPVGVTGQSLDCGLAVPQGLEESLPSCFVVGTGTSPTPSSDPQSAESSDPPASPFVLSATSELTRATATMQLRGFRP